MHVTLLSVTAILGYAIAAVSYQGYKVYKVYPGNQEKSEILRTLENEENLDFWGHLTKRGDPLSIMASPGYHDIFTQFLRVNDIPYIIEIDNVESTIQAEKAYHRSRPKVAEGSISFTAYHTADEINAYLLRLAQDYPDIVRAETIGSSYEGRDLILLRITDGPAAKPILFIDAGIHAREWIAPSSALYLIHQLVENPENRALISDVEWIVWPLINPDGYEFSRLEDRLWRKTRTPGTICHGVDGNRNFDYRWMYDGASDQECSNIFAGPRPFSEPETLALRNYVLSLTNVKLYLTVHSFGQYLLYPWGYALVFPDNRQELDDLGHAVNRAISAVSGTTYQVGSSTDLLYAAAGASDDWAMGGANISLVYTIELPGGGWYGFDLPATRILDVVEEMYQGFLAYYDYVAQNHK